MNADIIVVNSGSSVAASSALDSITTSAPLPLS
jgi:hypothetical protein